jgi:hypothetical protein
MGTRLQAAGGTLIATIATGMLTGAVLGQVKFDEPGTS